MLCCHVVSCVKDEVDSSQPGGRAGNYVTLFIFISYTSTSRYEFYNDFPSTETNKIK